jgi:hypothetical protein
MPDECTIFIVSDIHYASAAEKARGETEYVVIRNPLLRLATKAFRHFIWQRDPLAHNHRLEEFLQLAGPADHVVGVGDFACDTAFVGASDNATCASARECLAQLRQRFGDKFHAVIGDHELGKMSLFGGAGGLRLASWDRAQSELGLQPFWQVQIGNYRLIGVTSSLVALPVYEPETMVGERSRWWELRAIHLADIGRCFTSLRPEERVLLFCHDPTALPFLWREKVIQVRLNQVEQTFIGHLHSDMVFWESRLLAGMPAIHFLGNSDRRMSTALNEARHWRPFKVRLCPALSGIELLKDGGFLSVHLDLLARQPARFERHRMRH